MERVERGLRLPGPLAPQVVLIGMDNSGLDDVTCFYVRVAVQEHAAINLGRIPS
jgi:hypothetical protein